MFCYTAYGITINSQLFLPELIPSQGNADAVIRLGKVEHTPQLIEQSSYHIATKKEVLLYWKDVCTILVRQGCEIIVEPVPDVEPEKLRVFILGNALATLLHQRGLLVLHASAVKVERHAIAFIGDKGWGKSTTCAALNTRGYQVVTDDLLVIGINNTNYPIVYPAFPQLKLWPDSVTALGYNLEALQQIFSQVEKRAYQVKNNFSLEPLPLKCIYVLDSGCSLEIESIQQQHVFTEIVRHSFLAKLLQATATASYHFQQCVKLANSTPVYRLKRQRSLNDLPAIVKLLEEHIIEMSLCTSK